MTILMGTNGLPPSDPEAQWLLDALDKWRCVSEKPRIDAGWFHASQLGESDEELIAQYRGVLALKPHTARELRVFDNGHNRDAAMKGYLRDAGLSVVGEEEARTVTMPYLRLKGSLDDIVHHPETGEWWVFEMKTCNSYTFSQLREPKPAHRLQVTAYMAATHIEQAIVLYEAKNDQAQRAFKVAFDRELWKGIVERLRRLRVLAEAKDAEMPPQVLKLSRKFAEAMAEG